MNGRRGSQTISSLFKLDLTRKTSEPVKSPGGAQQTHRTVLCVGVTLVMLAVTLVGTMLSVGSRYQEMVFAKKWEDSFAKNGTAVAGAADGADVGESFTPLLGGEQFVIIPTDSLDGGGGGGGDVGGEVDGLNVDAEQRRLRGQKNETTENGGAPSFAVSRLPFYVDYLEP